MSAEVGDGNLDDEPLSFWEFFNEVFVPENRLAIPLKPAHKTACDELQNAVLNFNPKQFILLTMPPRIGKTKLLEALACWLNIEFPDSQDMFTSFSSTLVERSIRYIAMTMKSDWYREIFGDKVGDICNSELVTTTFGGNIYGAGIDGTITGFGAGLKRPCGGFIAIDDAAKPTEALSVTVAENVREVFELTIKSRRNSDQYCPIIICGQRLALDDLPGYIMATYPNDYHLIEIEAFNEETQTSNFPETYSTENLIAAKNSIQSNIRFAYWSQMQQKPIPQGGHMIPVDKFHEWDVSTASSIKWDCLLITCDTALKTKEHNDYSVLELWGKLGAKAYLIDLAHGKWESPDLLINARAFWKKHTADPKRSNPRFVIEEKAAGTGLIQQMKREGIPVEGIERNIDKVTRVKDAQPFIEIGCVCIPKKGSVPWVHDFLSECAQFRADGKAPHDDRCLIAGTRITCLRGQVPIEKVTNEDFALTRKGWRRVLCSGKTGTASSLIEIKSSSGNSITGTKGHPIFVIGNGFVSLDAISDGVNLLECETTKHHQIQTSLFSMELNSEDILTQNRSLTRDTILQPQTTVEMELEHSIRKSGNLFMDRFLSNAKFIIETATRSITLLRTWNALPAYNMSGGTLGKARSIHAVNRTWITWLKFAHSQLLGIIRQKVKGGTRNTQKTKSEHLLIAHAGNAEVYSNQSNQVQPFALIYAQGGIVGELEEWSNSSATDAERISSAHPLTQIKSASVISVRAYATIPVPVFNLSVQGENEYFANGILVHNCDAMADAIKILLGKPLSIFDVMGGEKKRT
jgi:predicted phage terminase large subunit-like protein